MSSKLAIRVCRTEKGIDIDENISSASLRPCGPMRATNFSKEGYVCAASTL